MKKILGIIILVILIIGVISIILIKRFDYSLGSGGITVKPGTVNANVPGSTANSVLYVDSALNLANDSDLTFNGSILTANFASTTAITTSGTASTTDQVFSAMSVNSVLFAGTDGKLTQDNANFYWNNSSNRLGIGTTSPATALDVNGTITQLTVKSCTLGLTTDALGSITGCAASDASLKTFINPFNYSALKLIEELNPVFYQFKNELGKNRIGFIAQEVEIILPEAVVSAGENLKGVDPNAINALLVKAIQEQQKEIDELKKEIGELKVVE